MKITDKVVVDEIPALRRQAMALAAAKGWTVFQFATRMGMTRHNLHRTLTAKTMTRPMWERLNRVLGTRPEDWKSRDFCPTPKRAARALMKALAARVEKKLDAEKNASTPAADGAKVGK